MFREQPLVKHIRSYRNSGNECPAQQHFLKSAVENITCSRHVIILGLTGEEEMKVQVLKRAQITFK